METGRNIRRRQFNNLTAGESESNFHRRLPEELIEEILSKLPAKSLLKFRCVSKSWRSLIDSERFIKAHLDNTNRNTDSTYRNIILNTRTQYSTLNHFSLHSLFNEPATNSFEYNDHSLYGIYRPLVAGCCNGIICLLTYFNHVFLWNPCTRMSKKLPRFGGDKTNYIKKYGFGFDGDYKVFVSASTFRDDGVGYHITEKVYNLKTNSWKLVNEYYEDVSMSQYCGAGKLASGNLHWAMKSGLNSEWVIRSFDLKNELYGIVEQPIYRQGVFSRTLGVLEGCLCVICDYPKSHLDIWRLEEYGVRESWNILWRVPLIPDVDLARQGLIIFPLCVGPNKEILLYYGSTFVIYYPKGNWFRYPKIHNIYDDHFIAEVYVESLVSLVSEW